MSDGCINCDDWEGNPELAVCGECWPEKIERLRERVGVDAGVIAGLRNPPPCKWQLDPIDCVYDTSCGESWVFPDGNAEENGVKFCPGCGHPVELTVTEVEDE